MNATELWRFKPAEGLYHLPPFLLMCSISIESFSVFESVFKSFYIHEVLHSTIFESFYIHEGVMQQQDGM